MKNPIIQTFNLTKRFGLETVAVNNLNITVNKGIYGFLGPNGAGKTTTIKMLIGSLFPTSGRIELFGEDITSHEKMNIHKRIGYVPENPTYFMGMTAEKLLIYIGSVFRLSKQEMTSRITNLLRLVELSDARHRVIAKFSAGMKQRIGIAQALMNDPELLILDEITSNLDPLGRNQMIDLLKDLRQEGKTMLISTHILPEIQKMNADSIGIIDRGQLIMEGSIQELNEKLGVKLVKISPNIDLFRNSLKPFVSKITEEYDTLVIETHNLAKVWQVIAEISLKNNIIVNEFRSSGLEIEQIFMKALEKENKSVELKHVE
ncbi:MAG: ABC transporter ATP-binding protein [Candidatus Heimdallarchaeota archaeon]